MVMLDITPIFSCNFYSCLVFFFCDFCWTFFFCIIVPLEFPYFYCTFGWLLWFFNAWTSGSKSQAVWYLSEVWNSRILPVLLQGYSITTFSYRRQLVRKLQIPRPKNEKQKKQKRKKEMSSPFCEKAARRFREWEDQCPDLLRPNAMSLYTQRLPPVADSTAIASVASRAKTPRSQMIDNQWANQQTSYQCKCFEFCTRKRSV